MRRIAIFAHYDVCGIVDEYVLQYLREIRRYVDDIIFVSDGILKDGESEKLRYLSSKIIAQSHGEYDFGSYKRGFAALFEGSSFYLEELEEIIFFNDSCYLVNSFAEIFRNPIDESVGAWSLCADHHEGFFDYLQSYFVVLRKQAFTNKEIKKFFYDIKKQKSKYKIIKNYEAGLSRRLQDNGIKISSYYLNEEIEFFVANKSDEIKSEIGKIIKNNGLAAREKEIVGDLFENSNLNYVHSDKFCCLLKAKFPLLKRSLISSKIIIFDDQKLSFFWKDIVGTYSDFDVFVIERHLARIGCPSKKPNDAFLIFRRLKFLINKSFNRKLFFSRKKTTKGKILVKICKIPIFISKA